jgi:hypothetical protein
MDDDLGNVGGISSGLLPSNILKFALYDRQPVIMIDIPQRFD